MQYRSSRIKAAPGVIVLPPSNQGSVIRRVWNAAADMMTLPGVWLRPRGSVEVGDAEIPLFYRFRQWTWRTERAVEVGLAKVALLNYPPQEILEVGNVLAISGIRGHTIVDKYEVGPGVTNVDIVDYRPDRTFDLVLSLSTFEHIGWDEEPRDESKAEIALDIVSRLGRDLLITIPVGYHRVLERAMLSGPFDSVRLLRKVGRSGKWADVPLSELEDIQYGRPYACGNGILIGIRGNVFGLSR